MTDALLGALVGSGIGALAGGAMTAIVAWLVLRHERRLRERDALEVAVVRAHGAANAWLTKKETLGLQSDSALESYTELCESLGELAARSREPYPHLSGCTADLHNTIVKYFPGRWDAEGPGVLFHDRAVKGVRQATALWWARGGDLDPTTESAEAVSDSLLGGVGDALVLPPKAVAGRKQRRARTRAKGSLAP